jgi:hypothetical protein
MEILTTEGRGQRARSGSHLEPLSIDLTAAFTAVVSRVISEDMR